MHPNLKHFCFTFPKRSIMTMYNSDRNSFPLCKRQIDKGECLKYIEMKNIIFPFFHYL